MRSALRCAALILFLTVPAVAKDVYLGIAGSVGAFRTDTRLMNPSGAKDIVVTAYFLPVGQDNSSAQSKTLTVPRRQMLVFNDVVATLFNASGLGGIRLSSPDDFVATSRIYAQEADGTLGQFVPGLDAAAAKNRGLLIQLKATGTTQTGTYRTNLGFVNPNAASTTVTLHVFDAHNTEVGTPRVLTLPAYGVTFPVALDASSADLTDAWVSYEASQGAFGFASVIDNGTTDPTFMTAFEDTGGPVVTPGITRLYLAPLFGFTLNTNPVPYTSTYSQVCFSSMSWEAKLGSDMAGTTYKFSLPVQTSNTASSTAGAFTAEIILKRGGAETVLVTTSIPTTKDYAVKTATLTGPDPDARAGDTLLLRLRIASGLPCIISAQGDGTDRFIEVPKTTVTQ